VRLALALFMALWTGAAAPGDEPAPARFGPNEGEVLQVDREAREITIRHGDLPELGMSPMSMVFVVADPGLLERVRKGDRVKFQPGLIDGRFGVLSIERVRRGGGNR
jgi:Cu(I)/Ag(I) efflux system periplasmic protein CusF